MNAEDFRRQSGTIRTRRDDNGDVILIRDDLTFWLTALADEQCDETIAATLLWVRDQLGSVEP